MKQWFILYRCKGWFFKWISVNKIVVLGRKNMGYYCNICKKPISEEVYDYSMKVYKKPLCMTHQKQNKNSKVTPQTKALYDALRKWGIKCKLEAYDGYKHVDISIEWAKLNIEIDG